MTAEIIKQAIKETYDGDLYGFVTAVRDDFDPEKKLPALLKKLGIIFHEDKDEERYDSYGSEDSILQMVFFHEATGKYFMFYGTRCSYQGEEWDGVKEVKLVEKTIKIYE